MNVLNAVMCKNLRNMNDCRIIVMFAYAVGYLQKQIINVGTTVFCPHPIRTNGDIGADQCHIS